MREVGYKCRFWYCRFLLFHEYLLALSTAEYQEARRCYCAWLWGRHGSRRLFIASVRRRVAAACWPCLYQLRPRFFKLVPKIKAIVGMGGDSWSSFVRLEWRRSLMHRAIGREPQRICISRWQMGAPGERQLYASRAN